MPSATFTDSRFRLDYSVTTVRQEIDNNRSLVRRVLVIVKTGSSYAWSNNTSYWSSSGPNSQSGTFTYNFGNYSSLTLMDRQDWVAHNADGTKSFTSSASVSADTPLGSASIGSFTVTLKTIPRATTPTVSGGFTTGAASTINLPRASSSFTHDVTYKIGSLTGTIATGAGTSASWTPPHTLMTELPNAASGTVEITVVTKNGSTSIGTKKINVTLTAAASIVPTISGVTWADDNPTVATNIGAFVQGVSLVKGTVTAAGVHGSTITSKRILLGGQSFAEGTAFLVNGSGTVTAQGEATDSRGRTTTVDSSFTVLPYLPPQIGANGWQVRRANSSNVPDDNGQYLRVDLHAVAASLKPASTEKNALTIQVRTKASDAGWVNRNTINPGLTHNTSFQVSGGAAFSTTKSYEVEITVTDKTSAPPVVLKTTVGTAVVTLDLNGDKVGVGKMHEFGTLDVAGDIYMGGVKVSVEGHTHNASAITAGTLAAARLPAATETAIGAVERATQAEVNAGADGTRYVTPKTLAPVTWAPTLGPGWSYRAETNQKFVVEPNGRVTLQCTLLPGTGNSTANILTVPSEVRGDEDILMGTLFGHGGYKAGCYIYPTTAANPGRLIAIGGAGSLGAYLVVDATWWI